MSGDDLGGRVVRRAHTPGVGGYAIAVLVSIWVTVVLLALSDASNHDPVGIAMALMVGVVYVTIFAVPTAPVGVLVVHLCCRRIEQQWVHVLAAGLCGVLTGLAFGAVVSGVDGLFETLDLTVMLGVATAVGRAAVIPLVPSRRKPVDDDFPAERSRC